MIDPPIVPRAAAPPFDWKTSLWPFLAMGGSLVGAIAAMGLLRKERKMTKMEKACLAFVVVLVEKVSDLDERRERLSERLAETDRKLAAETQRSQHAGEELEVARKRIKELEDQLALVGPTAQAPKPEKSARARR